MVTLRKIFAAKAGVKEWTVMDRYQDLIDSTHPSGFVNHEKFILSFMYKKLTILSIRCYHSPPPSPHGHFTTEFHTPKVVQVECDEFKITARIAEPSETPPR